MNAHAWQESELVTRSAARWGSLAAAVVFGIAFVVDDARPWPLYAEQVIQIAFVLLAFVGYALAWTKRREALGGWIALAATLGGYAFVAVANAAPADPFYLVLALPALLHLAAVAWRQQAERVSGG